MLWLAGYPWSLSVSISYWLKSLNLDSGKNSNYISPSQNNEIFKNCENKYPALPSNTCNICSLIAYLQHDWLFGGSRSGEVLHVPAAFVVESRPTSLVLPIPLDDEVAVEEVLLWRLAPQCQEVTCLLHFLYQDVPRPLRYHTHVRIPWESREGSQSHSKVMDGPPWLLPHSHPDYQTVSLWSLIEGGLSLWGWLACVCECTCAYSAWGALPCLCFLLCLDGGSGGWIGRTKAAMSGSLEFNDVCGKVCVFLCLCKRGGGLPLV